MATKRRPGRPSLGKGNTASFPVRLPAPLVALAKRRAALLGISRAELVRRALVVWLKPPPPTPDSPEAPPPR